MDYFNGQLHGLADCYSGDGALILKEYYIRGLAASAELWHNFNGQTLSAQIICGISGLPLRNLCLRELGYARFMSQMPHQIIQKDHDQALVLIRNWHPQEENICLVKVRCPSTGCFYALRVPPTMKTIKAAVAWTFRLEEKHYQPQKET